MYVLHVAGVKWWSGQVQTRSKHAKQQPERHLTPPPVTKVDRAGCD